MMDLTRVVELKLGQCHYSDFIRLLHSCMPRLHTLSIAETLFARLEMLDFRHVRSLTISDCLTNVDRMCLMFPEVSRLCLRLKTFKRMQRVIDLLDQTIINVTFRQVNEPMQKEFVAWLHERYGDKRQFSYQTDYHMNFHLWLMDFVA